eukprot:g1126.t1
MSSKERVKDTNMTESSSSSTSTKIVESVSSADVVPTVTTETNSEDSVDRFSLALVTREQSATGMLWWRRKVPAEIEPTTFEFKRRGGGAYRLLYWETGVENVKENTFIVKLENCDDPSVEGASAFRGPRVVLTCRESSGKEKKTTISITRNHKIGAKELTTFMLRLFDAVKRSKESVRSESRGGSSAPGEAEDGGDNFASSLRHEDLSSMTEIGKGAYGIVFRARYKKKLDVAVKRMPKEKVRRREILALRELKHSNIPRYYGYFERDLEGYAHVYLVMELCDRGDLETLLGAKDIVALCHERAGASRSRAPAGGPWTDRLFRRTLLGIVEGMVQMHMLGFAHRDLKPENVMLQGPEYVVKIADFGTVKQEERGDGDAALRTATQAGTELYMPWMDYQLRETGSGVLYVPKKHDVYSVGVMAWEMYTRVKPYSWYANRTNAKMDIERRFVRLETSSEKPIRTRPDESANPSSLKWPKEVTIDWVRWPGALQRLVNACVDVDLTKRPSFGEIKTRLIEDVSESTLQGGNGWWREASNESDAP